MIKKDAFFSSTTIDNISLNGEYIFSQYVGNVVPGDPGEPDNVQVSVSQSSVVLDANGNGTVETLASSNP